MKSEVSERQLLKPSEINLEVSLENHALGAYFKP